MISYIWNSKNLSVQKQVSGCLGQLWWGREGLTTKGGKRGWWKCSNLTTVMAAWLCTFTQTRLAGRFKWEKFIAWKICLNKAVLYKDMEEGTFSAISSGLQWPGGLGEREEGLANGKGPLLAYLCLWLPDNPGSTNITSGCSSGELAKGENPPWFLGKG